MYKIYCRLYQFVFRLVALVLPWRRPELLNDYSSLINLLHKNGIHSVLLVTDKGLTGLGLHVELQQRIQDAGILCVLYDKTIQNPTIDNIEDALELYYQEKCDALIALGGGSPMDCAKGVGARVACPHKQIPDMRGQLKVRKKLPLLIAVPTTAGSGSEATVAAIIKDSLNQEKYAINDPSLIPSHALLNPCLTIKLPPFITACTGIDALCHAVEAYIGGSNTQQTRQDALRAAKLVFENVYTAYKDGENVTARKNMQEAAFLAGTSFTRAFVGNVHAVAHAIGGRYGTPHGLVNAVILPYVLEMYGKRVHKTLCEMAVYISIADENVQPEEGAKLFIAAIWELNSKMGIPKKISDIQKDDISALAEKSLREANPLYPVPVIFGRKEMEQVYYYILENGNRKA